MKILTASQIREADQYTIANEPVSSLDLMERAANRLFEYLQPVTDPKKSIAIVCGTGNNGGDGLVLGRLLYEHQYEVNVYLVALGDKSEDFSSNEKKLPVPIENASDAQFDKFDVIIDAIFGSGLNRPVSGDPAVIIGRMNQSEAWKIAIDMPSGLFSDGPSEGEAIFRADLTLTFQQPKLALLMPGNGKYTGHWEILDIGLHPEYLHQAATPYHLVTEEYVRGIMKPRDKFSHKGSYGHALLVAGSKGKMGAAILSSRAALRSGLGLLTAYIPRIGYGIMQTAVPEAMVLVDEGDDHLTGFPKIDGFTTVGIGPGIGTDSQTDFVIEEILRVCTAPMVIDADALNILARQPHFMSLLPKNSILTPHPGEFRRLVGDWDNDFGRLEKQVTLAKKHGVIVMVKGAFTSIAFPEGQVFFNTTGNPGMATAGSGDVLTGILTGLLAQGHTPGESAIAGTYLHGLAGDFAASDLTEPAMISGDIIDYLPAAIGFIQ